MVAENKSSKNDDQASLGILLLSYLGWQAFGLQLPFLVTYAAADTFFGQSVKRFISSSHGSLKGSEEDMSAFLCKAVIIWDSLSNFKDNKFSENLNGCNKKTSMTITATILATFGVKSLPKDFDFHFIFHSLFLAKSNSTVENRSLSTALRHCQNG